MKWVTDIEAATGAPIRFVDSIMARQELQTEYEPTVRGRPRRFSYSNMLEIAFTHSLVTAGLKPSTAVAYATSFVRQSKNGLMLHKYLVLPNGRTDGMATNNFNEIENLFKGNTSLNIIPIAEIKRRIDAYYEENAI